MAKNRIFDDLVSRPRHNEDEQRRRQQIYKLHHELDVRQKELAELKKQLDQAEYSLTHDGLTRLHNRSFLLERMSRLVASLGDSEQEKRRGGTSRLSFIFVDIDHFKKVNDSFGHEAGDSVLRQVAQLLQSQVRGTDIVARWGGEEIVICLLGASQNEALSWAERTRSLVERTDIVTGLGTQKINVTVSLGVAGAELGVDFKAEEVIKQADLAMYLAKNGGRNQVVEYDPSLSEEAQKNSEIYKREKWTKFLHEVENLSGRVPALQGLDFWSLTEEDAAIFYRCQLAAEMEREIYNETVLSMQNEKDNGSTSQTLMDRVWEDFYFYTERMHALGERVPAARLVWCNYLRDLLKDAARGRD